MNHQASQSDQETFASPGFCRIDSEGIHLLYRFTGEYLIPWEKIESLEMPKGACRHDYLRVHCARHRFSSAVPVADRDNAASVLRVIAKYRPDLKN